MFLTQSGGFIIKPISRLLGAILSLLYRGLNAIGVESIGIAIILFTLIVRLIIFPLMYKQNRSSKIMSMIQPEINKATKKYRGKTDQQSMMEVTNLENKTGSLADALRGADIFVGVSAPNIVTADMVKTMNKDAIIFAMANPVPEIMPDVAKAAGAKVVGTGRSDFPNQVNNVIAFPGIFKGSEKHIVKIIISFFRGGNLRCLEGYLFPSAKQNPGCLRTGKRQGIFPQTFKFFDVPRIFPTGVAKHSFSNLAVDVAKAVLI